ncbi:uncharacterized protein Pyn_30633 [Prunus yedoensis var. nudiflora]|uniref:Uncharacterized protein n=1 Tax=Prunus yedoensis var. nudiflora TaxID=2094558 RepID=A0A314U8B8_PRUYE|nr:uncharacterized protein Pyn_30633 [Prunus yedoensis var. nudiflora]
MQRKSQNFLELLDKVESFISAPTVPCQRDLDIEALLSAECLPLLTLGDDHLEASVYYSAHRVRRQLGFDQGVPSDPSHGAPFSLHKVFWTWGHVPEDSSFFALALADKRRIGGLSKAYRNYWNRCFASFSRFHAAHCDRLLPTVVHHAHLVSEEKAISLSEKRNLPFTSRSGEIVGDFSKLKQKLEKPSSRSARRSTAHGKRKREGSYSVEKKRHATKSPKKFIPKVAASGPLSSKKNAPIVPSPQQQPAASGSSNQVVKMPEVSYFPNQKQRQGGVIPKRRSMRILQTRFADARKGGSKSSGPKVVVAVDDGSDEDDDAVETGISAHEQGGLCSTSGTGEDLDEDQYYSHDEDTYPGPDTHSEESDTSDMPPGFASSHERCMNLEPVVLIAKDMVGRSTEADSSPSAAVTGGTQTADEVKSIPQGADDTLPIPFLSTSDAAADTAPHLPVAPPLAPPLRTPDAAAGTSSQLPAALPPTSPCLGTPDTAAGTSPQLPAALLPTSPCLGTPNTATGTSP